MSNRFSAKHKLSRRLGVDIWGTSKSSFNKRAYKPGERHEGVEKRLSNYGLQLAEKQKLRGHYGNIGEKQFKRFFAEAKRLKGDTSANFVGLLERRLDAVIYRAKLAPTIFTARQFVGHGHVLVNGRKIDRPSYLVNIGDIISLNSKMHTSAIVTGAVESSERQVPSYLKLDDKHFSVEFVSVPPFESIPYPMTLNLSLVVEWYSRTM